MSSRKRRPMSRKALFGNVGLAVLAVATAGVIGAAILTPEPTPPVSESVAQAYAERTKPPVVQEYTLLTVVGDSYVAGSNMGGTGITNWTSLVSAGLKSAGNFDVTRSAAGGSGYVTRGPKGTVFAELLPSSIGPKSDLVVFFGSINDRPASPDQVGSAATAAYADVKRLAPGAKLMVIGPAWMSAEVPADLLANRDALQEAALNAGAAWVDPLEEGWFFDQPALIGTDKIHPTDEGHAYMQKLIMPHIQKALGAS